MGVKASTPSQESFPKNIRNLVLACVAFTIFVVILVIPVVPIQYTVKQTRTRNLQYSEQLYDKFGSGIDLGPYSVDVTNRDSVGGTFSVTMWWWMMNVFQLQLQNTSTQYSFIQAGTTHTFYVPWTIAPIAYLNKFNYSVSAPTTQEIYDVTKTKYEAILTLIENPLG